MSTHSTLQPTSGSGDEHEKRTWHRHVGGVVENGQVVRWLAVGLAYEGGGERLRLEARAATCAAALERLEREIEAFEAMCAEAAFDDAGGAA